MRKEFNQGTLVISESVIDFIVDVAVKETEGVELIVAPVKHTLRKIVGIRKRNKSQYEDGIEETGLSLRVEVAIDFGEIIPITCFMLQERIKNDVERMTGLKVEEVNVIVNKLILPVEEGIEND
ncbi:Asp23/Gls24 family envelope stress response protein [Alkalihalobacillus macyae]|uniref:Asp23/Gls24 family envelope stress response protein n=1 Tax=Guptibacillus hwajinpoensis TaxID=208199 RepID=UPI00273B157E|nr:Asp23/Gls24 family envelope stress response protein [Alkalihalobacillus macyae]MDP4553134.1 Asp23/Gls24 family envelope stress response protein [Alkalihalobacillus macyae]